MHVPAPQATGPRGEKHVNKVPPVGERRVLLGCRMRGSGCKAADGGLVLIEMVIARFR